MVKVKFGAEKSHDAELETKSRPKGKREGAAKPEDSVSGR